MTVLSVGGVCIGVVCCTKVIHFLDALLLEFSLVGPFEINKVTVYHMTWESSMIGLIHVDQFIRVKCRQVSNTLED